ncbi:MAG: N utilization substance protein B [Rickettsiaceae bacterium]|nr:N utilization substance protein B [Rickettsiaceae bacterium]
MQQIPLNSKTIARIAAIQTIYQYNNNPNSDINSLLMRIIEFYKDDDITEDLEIGKEFKMRPSYNYLKELVKYSYDNLELINKAIIALLDDKQSFTMMPKLLLSILQIAICEINFFPEIPKKVVVNEYTDIANDMLNQNEIGFVNSILDKYSNSK